MLKLIDFFGELISKIVSILLFVLLISVGIQVLGRYVPFIPRYFWTMELTNFALIWMVFLGSVVGIIEKKHFFIDFFEGVDNLPLLITLSVIYYAVLYSVTYIFIVYGYTFFIKWGLVQRSTLTGINMGWLYFSVPFTGICWFIFITKDAYTSVFKNNIQRNDV